MEKTVKEALKVHMENLYLYVWLFEERQKNNSFDYQSELDNALHRVIGKLNATSEILAKCFSNIICTMPLSEMTEKQVGFFRDLKEKLNSPYDLDKVQTQALNGSPDLAYPLVFNSVDINALHNHFNFDWSIGSKLKNQYNDSYAETRNYFREQFASQNLSSVIGGINPYSDELSTQLGAIPLEEQKSILDALSKIYGLSCTGCYKFNNDIVVFDIGYVEDKYGYTGNKDYRMLAEEMGIKLNNLPQIEYESKSQSR